MLSGSTTITGAEIFHRSMVNENVNAICRSTGYLNSTISDTSSLVGYNGAAVVTIFDAIYRSPHFQFILSRHEQGAGHMAQGYARVTGKPGVVLVTSGPGTSNIVTPVLDASMDGTPLVVFCGQVSQSSIGTDAFQEIPTEQIMQPCAKKCFVVDNIGKMSQVISDAFRIALTGRPGPVVVIIPRNISEARIIAREGSLCPRRDWSVSSFPKARLSRAQSIANLMNASHRPVILAGQGTAISAGAADLLGSLAHKAKIPVATTLLGLGVFDETEDLALHMIGQYGSSYGNRAIEEADLLLVLGARLDDRVVYDTSRFARKARLNNTPGGKSAVIHVDIRSEVLNRVILTELAVLSDIGNFLTQLIPHIIEKHPNPPWIQEIKKWKEQSQAPVSPIPGQPISPPAVIHALVRQLGTDIRRTIITTGVGQHQMWAARHYLWQVPRSLVTSGSLGTMGFGLPSAIGAKVGRPEALVIDIDGDASFNMTMEELLTATQERIDVKVIMMNNGEQGMVTEWQQSRCSGRFAHSHQSNPCYKSLAVSMGFQAQLCTSYEDLDMQLTWLLNTTSPSLLDIRIQSKLRQLA